MSKNAAVTISWVVTGDGVNNSGAKVITIMGAAGESILAPVTVGRNQIFLPGPPTMSAALINPPSNSSVVKTLDAASTTGMTINSAEPTFVALPAGTTSINIGASGSETIEIIVF